MEISHLEFEAKLNIVKELSDDLSYLTLLYNVAHEAYRKLDGSDYFKSTDLSKALIIILGRITDYLRSIHILIELGYPEQAGTLAASILELAHTAYYFTHDKLSLSNWLKAGQIEEIRKVLGGKNWKQIIEANFKTELLKKDDSKHEYWTYQQLCWMKHSLPARQDFRMEKNNSKVTMALDLCPKFHHTALHDARFVVLSAGQEVELAIIATCIELQNDISNKLNTLKTMRFDLLKKYQHLYGTENPFVKN